MTWTAGDVFLSVVSATSEVPLSGGNGVFSLADATVVRRQDHQFDYWHWLTNLEELSSLWLDHARDRLVTEAPFLTLSPLDSSTAFLCGARTPNYLREARKHAQVLGISITSQSIDPSYPSTIKVKGAREALTRFANLVSARMTAVPLPYLLAQRPLDPLDLLIGGLPAKVQATGRCECTLQAASLLRFDDFADEVESIAEVGIRLFNPSTLRYDGKLQREEGKMALGLREFHGRKFNLYRFHLSGKVQAVADVNVGYAKYICMSQAGMKLGYNRLHRSVVVPRYCRLPRPLGRALALCSCAAPMERALPIESTMSLGYCENVRDFIEYRDVPEVIAVLAAKKLSMQLQDITFTEDALLCKTQ